MNQITAPAEDNARDVIEALAMIDAAGGRCVEFVPGEALYQAPREALLVRAEQVHRIEARGVTQLMRAIDMNGRDVSFTQDDWDAHIAGTDADEIRSWRRRLNGAIRVGKLLAYSYGEYSIAQEFDLDGKRMIQLAVCA